MPDPDGGRSAAPGDLDGRRFVVTGANSGIGEAAARMFAERGATVVLACRDAGRASQAVDRIRARFPAANLDARELDLASLASVRAFAASITADGLPVDVLVNNAGVMGLPRRETADGFELQLGTNHLGHFALTGLLLPSLLAASAPRVVTVASSAHKFGTLDLTDLQRERDYDRWKAYGQSKLANLLFTFELQRRADAAGTGLRSTAAHPGLSSTNLAKAGPAMEAGVGGWLRARLYSLYGLACQSADAGARPTVMAATRADAKGGDYFGPSGPAELWGRPRLVSATPAAHDPLAARLLWERSEELTGVTFDAMSRNE